MLSLTGSRRRSLLVMGSAVALLGATSTITAINADGHTANDPNAAAFAPGTVFVSREGFTATGTPTRHTFMMKIRRRFLQGWGGYVPPASTYVPPFDGNKVIGEDCFYATDIVTSSLGVVDNTLNTLQSPPPISAWGMVSGTVCGDSIAWQIVAGHRNIGDLGSPNAMRTIACVEVWAVVNGVESTHQFVSSITEFADPDPMRVQGFEGVHNLAGQGLADNAELTLHARVYPVYGVAASVRSTVGVTNPRLFRPQFYWRSTSRAAAPFTVYIQPGAVTAGVCSQTVADALASPCPDWQTARTRAIAAMGTNNLDGLRVRLMSGFAGLPWPSATATNVGACQIASIVFEKDPDIVGDLVLTNSGTSRMRLLKRAGPLAIDPTNAAMLANVGIVAGTGLRVTRSANTSIFFQETGNPFRVQFVGSKLDAGNFTATFPCSTLGNNIHSFYWVEFQNGSAAAFGTANATSINMTYRGCTNTSGSGGIEGQVLIGNRLNRMTFGPTTAVPTNQVLLAFNYATTTSTDPNLFGWNGGSDCLEMNNIWECIANAAGSMVSVSREEGASSINFVRLGNTYLGAFEAGRSNSWYDETIAAGRTHLYAAAYNNIFTNVPMKGTRFIAVNENRADLANARTGNYFLQHGAGMGQNFILYAYDDSPFDFGEGSVANALLAILSMADIFENYRGTTYNGSAYASGLGDSNARLKAMQPAVSPRGIVTRPHLPFNAAGLAPTFNAGVY